MPRLIGGEHHFTLKLAKTYTGPGYSFSYEGPATVVNTGDDGALMEFNRQITDPGLYFITANDVEVVDNVTSVPHSDTVAIMAEDKAQFDLKLTGTWGGMSDALSNSNNSQALRYISYATKEKYSFIFEDLADFMPDIMASMRGFELVYVDGILAKYRVLRDQEIDGQILTITYFIYFVKGADGLWRIESM